MRYRKHLPIIILLVFFFCSAPSLAFSRAQEIIDETYSVDQNSKVDLQCVNGQVFFNSWEANEIGVKITKVTQYEKDLANVVIDISAINGYLKITSHYRKTFGIFGTPRVDLTFEISVPQSAAVNVETVSADAELRGIGGDLDITTVSGEIMIQTAKGDVRSKTVSGDITMRDIRGDVEVATTSGDVNVDDLTGSFEVESISGDVEVNGFSQSDRIDVKTISGNIDLSGDLETTGTYRMDSTSGDVSLVIRSTDGFELLTETRSGDLACDFDVTVSGGRFKSNSLRGVVGKGAARLSITTTSGDIRISKR
jgi:DUF4097 and DUF4098 domain-containing protein YvlB